MVHRHFSTTLATRMQKVVGVPAHLTLSLSSRCLRRSANVTPVAPAPLSPEVSVAVAELLQNKFPLRDLESLELLSREINGSVMYGICGNSSKDPLDVALSVQCVGRSPCHSPSSSSQSQLSSFEANGGSMSTLRISRGGSRLTRLWTRTLRTSAARYVSSSSVLPSLF
jgi:hypothetical protein